MPFGYIEIEKLGLAQGPGRGPRGSANWVVDILKRDPCAPFWCTKLVSTGAGRLAQPVSHSPSEH